MNNDQNNNSRNDLASERLQELSRRGLNAATGGAWNKVRNVPIVGAAAKRSEEKIADKLGNNRLVRKLNNNANGHERPNLGAKNSDDKTRSNNPKNGDIGSRNLRNSLANKGLNLLKSRKKKKQANDNNSNTSDNLNNNENTTSPLDDVIEKTKVRIKVKIIIYSAIILMCILIILAFFMAIFGVDIAQSIPSVGPMTYGTDNFTPTYAEGTKEYKDEINYYKKLKEISKSYENNYGEELKTNYIHAVLIYLYYNVDAGEISENGENIPIDYNKMSNMVDKVVSLMTPSENSKTIDYSKNGVFYNNLKNSNDIRNYYQKLLKEKDIDTILNEVFDLAKGLDDISYKDDTVVTSETNVSVKETKTENGKTTTTTKKVSMNEYLADAIYATSSSLSSESVKAYTIAYSTNVVSQNKNLTIDSNIASATTSLCSVSLGCSYDDAGNLVSGKGSQSSKNTIYQNGGYYYKLPLTNSEIFSLNTSINSVFGNVLVNSDGTYPTLDINKINGLGDSYQNILSNSYGNYSLKNIGEDSYILDGNYGIKLVKTEVIFYDQNDYQNSFCGLRNETIESSGCGITAMAMVASTYENNKKYDPIYMNSEATNKKMCGAGSGTLQSFFSSEASSMKYKYLGGSKYNKSLLNNVLKHLSAGHLVIARMGPSHFTGAGHYIVLGGVDPSTKKVYVYDPNNKDNSRWRKTGNGWYSFNDIIVKEAYNFYIIWKG